VGGSLVGLKQSGNSKPHYIPTNVISRASVQVFYLFSSIKIIRRTQGLVQSECSLPGRVKHFPHREVKGNIACYKSPVENNLLARYYLVIQNNGRSQWWLKVENVISNLRHERAHIPFGWMTVLHRYKHSLTMMLIDEGKLKCLADQIVLGTSAERATFSTFSKHLTYLTLLASPNLLAGASALTCLQIGIKTRCHRFNTTGENSRLIESRVVRRLIVGAGGNVWTKDKNLNRRSLNNGIALLTFCPPPSFGLCSEGFFSPVLFGLCLDLFINRGSFRARAKGRSYFVDTRSFGEEHSEPYVEKDGLKTLPMDRLAKHWHVCYTSPNKTFSDLKGLIKLRELWYAAYHKLNRNKRSKTPRIDGVSEAHLDRLRENVLKGKFHWKPIGRIHIPVKGKGESRPLGILSRDDSIVQEVVRMIIEPIFEFSFSDNSHGFRPSRNCHTALRTFYTKSKSCSWFIETDISKCSGKIVHKELMKRIKLRVRDPIILNLIRSGLKAKVISFERILPLLAALQRQKVETKEREIDSGQVLSPLLWNIYFDLMDKFIEKEIMEKYQGKITSASDLKTNNLYRRVMRTQGKSEVYRRKLTDKIYKDPEYIKITFVRYAHDFLLGVTGSLQLAKQIREEIRVFLEQKLKLKLNLEKTKITHVSKKIEFLGYKFSRRVFFTRQKYGSRKFTRKMTLFTMNIDMDRLIKFLKQKGFCDGKGKPIPNFKKLNMSQSDSNSKINSILRGLSEWCKFAGNRRSALSFASYVLRFSAAKTYAAKFKLKTIAKVLKTAGRNLSKPIGRRMKSILGAKDEKKDEWPKSVGQIDGTAKKQIPKILFSRYSDTPKSLKPIIKSFKPKHVKMLEENNLDSLIEEITRGNPPAFLFKGIGF
jgi:retron-type reverse transcriptase